MKPADYARTLRRFADRPSMACSELAGILPATLPGFFLRVLAAPKGDPEDQKIGWALAHPSHLGGAKAHPIKAIPFSRLREKVPKADEGALALGPVWGGGGRTKRPEGSARWIAPIPLQAMDGLSAEPGRPQRTSAQRRRHTRVPFLLVTSLWASKEK